MESCLDQSLNSTIRTKYLYSKLFKYDQSVEARRAVALVSLAVKANVRDDIRQE
jgi:hypothetical protein